MITVTHPGRVGDLLWACPALRALAQVHGPVHLHLPGEFEGMTPLLEAQAYVARVTVDHDWSPTPGEGMAAPACPHAWNIGYRGWPQTGLPYETYRIGVEASQEQIAPLDLETPWITLPESPLALRMGAQLACAWTEAWFELKYGVTHLLSRGAQVPVVLTPHGSRWQAAGSPPGVCVHPCTLLQAAYALQDSLVVLADCSALHVLTVALGKPVLVMEPMEARWNPIFWPLGMDGPRVRCVKGLDGQPTFDARHVRTAVQEALQHA